jgi:hypothetical protein
LIDPSIAPHLVVQGAGGEAKASALGVHGASMLELWRSQNVVGHRPSNESAAPFEIEVPAQW